jgi:hypothetical protein
MNLFDDDPLAAHGRPGKTLFVRRPAAPFGFTRAAA